MNQQLTYNAVISVIGQDRIGIIAQITTLLASSDINILDISQTILQDVFTMIMLVDTTRMNRSNERIKEELKALSQALNVTIQMQHKDVFNAMQRI